MLHENRVLKNWFQRRFFRFVTPAPCIPEPKLRQHMDRSGLRSAIDCCDLHEDVLRIRFRILDEQIEVTVLAKNAGVDQFELRVLLGSPPVLLNKLGVRKRVLRIFIESLQIRMRWRSIEVVIDLFDVFAMVSLAVRETEQALLQNRILLIPEREPHANALVTVAEAANTVFAPTIGATTGVIVREIVPGRSTGTIVLTHCSPLALAQIGAPTFPMRLPAFRLP